MISQRLPWVLWAALLVPAAVACGDDDEASPVAETGEPEAPRAPVVQPWAALLHDVDARELSADLRAAASSPDPALRRTAVLGLARLHDAAAAPLLRRALRDPDPEVRRAASLGLGAFEDGAPRGTEAALLAALAAEREAATRAAMVWDLGRIGSDAALPALREALAGNEPTVRAAACEGLGFFGLRSRVLPPPLLRRIAARMVDDTDPAVRLACSYALTRLAPPVDAPEEAKAIAEDLGRALGDEDDEVRAMAVRALGRYPEPPVGALAERTLDPDWRVAVQAFRALAKAGPGAEAAYARSLRARLDRALDAGTTLEGPEAHVLLGALAEARPFARGSAVHGVAVEAFERLGRLRDGQPALRDRGLAHCAAAALVDVGRGWPTRLLDDCGLGQVSEEERRVAAAEVLATVEGAERERLLLLRRLYEQGDVWAREAAIAAATTVDPVAAAPLVLGALRSGDAGVITAAAEALAALAPRWRAAGEEAAAAPVLSVRPAGSPPPQASPAPAVGPPEAQVSRALRAAWDHLREHDETEGLSAWAAAVEAAGLRAFDDRLLELAKHPVVAVRDRARAALESLGVELPADLSAADVRSPLPAGAFPGPDEELHAVIETSRGTVRLALRPDLAPATVARFTGLAREGFYDGLTFHRVVPAFVVQGGDPRGDGYGGPGWTQRCEDNRLPYARGTVGMALAGRDTGGSQFFITHSAQPHLEGRYTAFGRVVSGMEAVDELQQGDRIEAIRLESSQARPAGR